ncbi:ATP-binding cassette domain-containing protein [Dankookia sp. P2]|uniref:ATP-binding cassette domain-containing protein n=1 Tax=Dankookia sp. P2 TaxID=3423955 RepID=UPI003D672D3A
MRPDHHSDTAIHAISHAAPALEVARLSFAYAARQVLHDIAFRVMPGEFAVLLGPNGAGKSTLLLSSPDCSMHRRRAACGSSGPRCGSSQAPRWRGSAWYSSSRRSIPTSR